MIQTIQRVATETAIENSVSVFHIDNDEVKGRIIGREGRNIRALEAATGVEIVVDDTPEAIVISAFDPVRREVCRLALHQLVADGRIHPARIEEVVAKVKKYMIQNGLSDCGLDATTDDLENFKTGNISKQLRYDWTHFNCYGYYSKGIGVYKKGVELGYWS